MCKAALPDYMARIVRPPEQCGTFLSFTKRNWLVSPKCSVVLREGTTQCSNEVYNEHTNTRQHNIYLFEHIGYMFRPVNRSSSGLQVKKVKGALKELGSQYYLQL